MPATVIVAGISLARPEHGRSDVEGEQDDAVEETQEEQGQPLEQEEPEARQVDGAPEYRALLDRQDERIHELESQVAEAARSRESAEALAAEIERLRSDAAEERVGYELRLAAASSRSVSHQHSRHYRAKKPA